MVQSKNPASVIVFVAVASDCKLMPPHFIKVCLKINSLVFLKILIDVLLPLIRGNFSPNKVMISKDSALAHGNLHEGQPSHVCPYGYLA